jgi:hypothetical protein
MVSPVAAVLEALDGEYAHQSIVLHEAGGRDLLFRKA